MKKIRVMSWDWKEDPDFDKLAKLVFDVSRGTVFLYEPEPDTGSDQFAIVLSDGPLDDDEVQRAVAEELGL